jgi:hypothetical protein
MDETRSIVVVAVDQSDPRRDPETALVAAAIGAGWRWADDQAMLHTIEREGEGEQLVRRTRWALLDEPRELDGERITFRTFRERFEDITWLDAHPEHTITRLWRGCGVLHMMHTDELVRRPCYLARHGMLWALIPPDMPKEEATAMMAEIYQS